MRKMIWEHFWAAKSGLASWDSLTKKKTTMLLRDVKFFPFRFYCSVSNIRPLLPGILPCRLYILTHRFQLTVSSKCTWDFPGIPGSSTPPLSYLQGLVPYHIWEGLNVWWNALSIVMFFAPPNRFWRSHCLPFGILQGSPSASHDQPKVQEWRLKFEGITIHHTTSKKGLSTFAFPICSKGRTVLISFVRTGHFGLWKTMVKRNYSMI